MKHQIKIKRAYNPADPTDGIRILVDRIWPRGLSKSVAAIDEWNKAIAPTVELRKWFGHQEERFEIFRKCYLDELELNVEAVCFATHCSQLLDTNDVTLIFGARSMTCNHALVLRDWLVEHM